MKRRRAAARGRARMLACALAAASAAPASAAAADGPLPLEFSADDVEMDARLRELSLAGHVVVGYERFRLTSERLHLKQTPRGVRVDGDGRVVFCPCPTPPVAVGFEGALVGPPADLLLDHPRLEVFGTTVLALPWFWLRAPTKAGVLPPRVAWRGADGLLVGEGVHVPWRHGEGHDELDLTAAGYLKGGVELTAALRTEHSTSRVRWDHLGDDLVAVDASGSAPDGDGGAAAWDVDSIRGPRARRGTIDLGEAARAYDRAAFEQIVRPATLVVGAGVRATASRGGAAEGDSRAWGPRASVGASGALGGVGAWDALAALTVQDEPVLGTTSLGRSQGGVELDARPGPVVARVAVRGQATAASTAASSGLDAIGTGRVDLGVPLVRTFGEEEPIVHVIEPRAEWAASIARTSGEYWAATGRPVALAEGRTLAAAAGARTSWGRLLGRSGATAEAMGGAIATRSEDRPVARWRAAWSSRWVGVGGEGAALFGAERGQVTLGRVRFGDADGWHLAVRGAGRAGVEPVMARALAASAAREPSGGWLADEGWSAGAEIGARLGGGVGARASADEDVTSKTLLGVRGALSYLHPCRCLAVDVFAAHRLGREGVDAWVAIDLVPR